MKKKNQKGFVQIILILVIVVVAIGGAYYFGTLKNKKNLTLFVPTSTPSASSTPVAEAEDPTNSWKTYSNTEFSFKYPESWSVDGKRVFSVGKTIEIWAATSEDPLYNECMKFDSNQKILNLTVKTYSGVTSSEMCDSANLNKKEKWIVRPDGEGYQPGIQYLYKVNDSKAEEIFDQILSTFKFTK